MIARAGLPTYEALGSIARAGLSTNDALGYVARAGLTIFGALGVIARAGSDLGRSESTDEAEQTPWEVARTRRHGS